MALAEMLRVARRRVVLRMVNRHGLVNLESAPHGGRTDWLAGSSTRAKRLFKANWVHRVVATALAYAAGVGADAPRQFAHERITFGRS